MDSQTVCPKCGANISAANYFCSQCGQKIKEKPLSTTFGRQLLVYLLSFCLPPLGLWPAVKYWRQPDGRSKRIGLVAFILTIVSISLSLWLTIKFTESFSQSLNDQLNLYQGIGY